MVKVKVKVMVKVKVKDFFSAQCIIYFLDHEFNRALNLKTFYLYLCQGFF